MDIQNTIRNKTLAGIENKNINYVTKNINNLINEEKSGPFWIFLEIASLECFNLKGFLRSDEKHYHVSRPGYSNQNTEY